MFFMTHCLLHYYSFSHTGKIITKARSNTDNKKQRQKTKFKTYNKGIEPDRHYLKHKQKQNKNINSNIQNKNIRMPNSPGTYPHCKQYKTVLRHTHVQYQVLVAIYTI